MSEPLGCTYPQCPSQATVRVCDTTSLSTVDRCDDHSPPRTDWTVVPICPSCVQDVLIVTDAVFCECRGCGEEYLRNEVEL